MFDFIKKLFGEGTMVFAIEGFDKNGKRVEGKAKVPYVGDRNTANMDEIKATVKNRVLLENDIAVTSITYLGDI